MAAMRVQRRPSDGG
ncbi:hypothetical protein A2U01_0075769, partial [Trifolium medium]|nr:hypothetical protein [Trifolium medium]